MWVFDREEGQKAAQRVFRGYMGIYPGEVLP